MTMAFIPQKNSGEFARNTTDYLNKETSHMLPKAKRTKGMNRLFLYKEKKKTQWLINMKKSSTSLALKYIVAEGNNFYLQK